MGADDSLSLVGTDSAASLRDQQLVAVNEYRGLMRRCTAISQPTVEWTKGLLAELDDNRKEPAL
jgi:hypothetical protein